ncbi:hypothetical protein ACFVAV_00720 [Nocardia sp. NPDC057663]|uniref:hypothetical protein n=1 Tax=Nocardia sp. NPDC057663 TaxID=3346201 RepID=UPI00366C027B
MDSPSATKTAFLTISAPLTAEPTTPPLGATPTAPSTGRPAATDRVEPTGKQQPADNHLGDALGIGGFLLAVAVSTLLLRRQRPHRERHREPHAPRVRVGVGGDATPSIAVHEFDRAPTVRIRIVPGEPRCQIEEVTR